MDRLEVWARGLGEGGVTTVDGRRYFPSRQMTQIRAAYREGPGKLMEYMTGWLPDYRRDRSTAPSRRMADIVKAGLVPWEALLLERDQPWAHHVSDLQRMVLCRVMSDTYDDARSLYDSRLRPRSSWHASSAIESTRATPPADAGRSPAVSDLILRKTSQTTGANPPVSMPAPPRHGHQCALRRRRLFSRCGSEAGPIAPVGTDPRAGRVQHDLALDARGGRATSAGSSY
jgi:hypothetical protein